jgi:hypothetical protein
MSLLEIVGLSVQAIHFATIDGMGSLKKLRAMSLWEGVGFSLQAIRSATIDGSYSNSFRTYGTRSRQITPR